MKKQYYIELQVKDLQHIDALDINKSNDVLQDELKVSKY